MSFQTFSAIINNILLDIITLVIYWNCQDSFYHQICFTFLIDIIPLSGLKLIKLNHYHKLVPMSKVKDAAGRVQTF